MGRDDGPAAVLALASRFLGSGQLEGGWFALGGSSIDAARLVAALDQEFGVRLPLPSLLAASSVRACLTAAAAGQAAQPPGDPVPPPGLPSQPRPAGDLLWPALAVLPAPERVALAHRLIGSVLARGSAG